MSNVIIGLIGVVIFIGLALAGALYFGDTFTKVTPQKDAARYISEGSQISKAYELYGVNTGAYPTGSTENILDELKATGYLKAIPEGGEASSGDLSSPDAYKYPWFIDQSKGAAMTLIGSDSGAINVCTAARKQAGFTDLQADILSCDDPNLSGNDPCCKISSGVAVG